jgi:DNA-binding transcriptional LysR family regulator
VRPNNFADISVFVTVVNAGSFATAAKQVGLTRSAVGKSIARLEARLNLRLLNRSPRSLSLTDDGMAFFGSCVRILSDLEDTEAAMAERSAMPQGRLRVSLPIALGQCHFTEILSQYLQKWSNISLDVAFNDRFVDLIEEGFDIAVRVGAMRPDSNLITRVIARQKLVLCASPAYFESKARPESIDDLEHHDCIFFVHSGRPMAWSFIENKKERQFVVPSRLQMSSAQAIHEITLQGRGIAKLPSYLVASDIRAGRLVPLLDSVSCLGEPIRVVYLTRQHLSPKIRCFIDLITESWGQIPPWERDLQLG